MKKNYFALILSLLIIITNAKFVFADEQSAQNQSLSVTPFIFEETLQKGESVQRQITLNNNSPVSVGMSAQISNFVSGEQYGEPVFVSPDQQQTDDPNSSLSDWMKITTPPPTQLASGKTAKVTVSINVPKSAEDGGHYGAILFSYTIPNAQVPGAVIQTKTAVLFLITTGIANEQGNISSFTSDKNIYVKNTQVNFGMNFANTGNVHLAPKGIIDIYNIFGKLVAAVQLNRDAQLVFPNSNRSFESAWNDPWGFGLYTAQLKVYYGGNNYEAHAQKIIWILPYKHIIVAILLIVLIIVLLWFAVTRYNRWVINKHNKGNKK